MSNFKSLFRALSGQAQGPFGSCFSRALMVSRFWGLGGEWFSGTLAVSFFFGPLVVSGFWGLGGQWFLGPLVGSVFRSY